MANDARVGPYLLSMEPRGLRLVREDSNLTGGTRGLLTLTLAEQGKGVQPFTLSRLTTLDPNNFQIAAYCTDQVSLEGRLSWRPDLEGFEFSFQLINSTRDMAMRVGVHLGLQGDADPKWIVPGLFYGDNRVRDCKRIYPGYSEIHRDPAKFLSNNWAFRSDRAAMPVVFCTTFSVFGFLATDEVPPVGKDEPPVFGCTAIGLSTEQGSPELSAWFPYLEAPVKYSYCRESRTQPEETFYRLDKNTRLSMRVRLGLAYKTDGAWRRAYRALYKDYWPNHTLRPKLSTIDAERLAIDGLLHWHLDNDKRMIHETSAFDKHFGLRGTNVERRQMHVGWLSGALPAYVLLWHGRDVKEMSHVNAATAVFDLITAELAPCGTIWPMYTAEDGYTAGFGPEPGLAHARTIGEGVLFILRALRLDLQAQTSHPQWFKAIKSSLDYAISVQREDGALPAYWSVNDGTVWSYNGMSGLVWVACLAAAQHFFPNTRYRDAACRAGEYYAKFIEEDFLYGCVEDLPLVPTGEDGHFALISYILLYELHRDERWLNLARRSAEYCLSWRMAYNVSFPSMSMLGQAHFGTRGGDIGSVATPVLGATGLISYGEMIKLSALTGDTYYETRARESRTFATQLIARVDGEFNARAGHAIAQIYHTDWWQPKGMVLSLGHAWSCALIKHAELLERHMNIPLAAVRGDSESILAASSRSSVVEISEDLQLPESAEERRRKQLERARQAQATRPKTRAEEMAEIGSQISKIIGISSLGDDQEISPNELYSPTPQPSGLPPGAQEILAAMREEAPTPKPTTKMPAPSKTAPLSKSPFERRHTPLAKDEELEPVGGTTPAPFAEHTPPGGFPPPSSGLKPGGLLAGLFEDPGESQQRFVPLKRTPPPAAPPTEEVEAGSSKGVREDIDPPTGEIKYKIF